ncbi:MAG: helix-turn-helix domain-containing protein [Patescibacteria group bacterium]|nr:helix-turn-helix domain-containing protein [Patescibacteria group bacterium]
MKSQLPEILKRLRPLKLAAAAEYLGVHPNTLKNYEKDGILKPSFQLPRRHDRMYTIRDLDAFRRRYHSRIRKAEAMRKSKSDS